MFIWMVDRAFEDGATLLEPDPDPELTCEDVDTSVGSCVWFFMGSLWMCEDYIGDKYRDPNHDEWEDPEAKCLDPDIRGGVYEEGVKCGDRTEEYLPAISGKCAIDETESGAYVWTQYEPFGAAVCPARFFECESDY